MTQHAHAQLNPSHEQQLASSAIDASIIAERGYRSIAPGAAADVKALAPGAFSDTVLRSILHQGALAFPIYRLGQPTPYTWVLRPEQPRSNRTGDLIKYEWPRNTANVFDLLPRYGQALGDPQVPIWITEGTKKADALASAYAASIVPVNENGVWGWRAKNVAGGKTALADLELIAWDGRTVIIAPDGDVRYNKHVLLAVQRLARLLMARYNVAEVLVLELPQTAQGPKIGIDDYLAQGHTTQEVEQYLRSLGSVSSSARVALGTHPDSGARLFLPAGYDVRAHTIVRLDRRGEVQPIYSGGIYIKEVGRDLYTHEQTALISWNGRGGHEEITIPYAALSDSRAFSALVGAAGAAVHPRNIKDVQAFLVEFVQENTDALPRRAHVDRLGLIGTGVVCPAGTVGFDEEVRYSGRPAISVGTDAEAYPAAIQSALLWPDAWAFWLTLSLSLAAPAIARLRPRRNPVLYLSGASGSGKTTTTQFATGCWGNPTRHPLRLEAGRTTPAGIFQTLEHLNGLPALIDEAHTIADPKRLEMACYSFANGQRYTVGGADQKARGGSDLYGTLLLAGEAIPEFKHAGARLRVLWADAGTWLPMGAEARSSEGQARAQLLEAAWEGGAGLFGLDVTRRIWGDWGAFTADVRTMEADEALSPLQAWRQPLAIATVALNVALQAAGVTSDHLPDPAAWVARLLDEWATMLTTGHDEADPATSAWEALITMLVQGKRCSDADEDPTTRTPIPDSAAWEWIESDRGGVVAARKAGDDFWRVITTTPQFKERIGESATQLYGQAWLKRGWIQVGKDGKSTDFLQVRDVGRIRVLKVPLSALDTWT
jgi:hypothetical protein